jgi:citrate lyase subunit beta/citryl-CoA lyase/(S)-citramalyl-CoA lyase
MAYRSLLFVPGSRPDRFDKAAGAGADAVCIDLEDAVPPDGKDAARTATLAALDGRFGLRVNAVGTADGEGDFAALNGASPVFVMIPKAASVADGASDRVRVAGRAPSPTSLSPSRYRPRPGNQASRSAGRGTR